MHFTLACPSARWHLILSGQLEQLYLIDGSQGRLLPYLKHTGSRLRKERYIELSLEDKAFKREWTFALSFRNCNHDHH